MVPIPVGARAPNFTFVDTGGLTWSLADFRGAPVLPLGPRPQPVLQYRTLEDERVPGIAARGDRVGRQYGLDAGGAVLSWTGPAESIANAVYHATGIRVRDLAITLDRLFKEGLHA